jgi:excisionase family DNA binding protein
MTADDLRPALVDTDSGARFVGLGRSKFLELVYSGQIGSIKVGTRRLIPVTELERWVREQMTQCVSGGAA